MPFETWSLEQAAAYLRVHADTLSDKARAGEVPGCKIGRAWVFDPDLLKKYLEAKCLSTAAKVARNSGVVDLWPVNRISAQLACVPTRKTAPSKRKSSSTLSENASGDAANSETAARSLSARQSSAG